MKKCKFMAFAASLLILLSPTATANPPANIPRFTIEIKNKMWPPSSLPFRINLLLKDFKKIFTYCFIETHQPEENIYPIFTLFDEFLNSLTELKIEEKQKIKLSKIILIIMREGSEELISNEVFQNIYNSALFIVNKIN